jgi:hypothetical protein
MAKSRLASGALLHYKYHITFINFVKETLQKIRKNLGQSRGFAEQLAEVGPSYPLARAEMSPVKKEAARRLVPPSGCEGLQNW